MSGRDPLECLVPGPVSVNFTRGAGASGEARALPAIVVGELVALVDHGRQPLLAYAGQPGHGALQGRTLVDLEGRHVGRAVVLLFEDGDPTRPVVIGLWHEAEGWPLPELPGQVEVEAGGARLIVSARRELVLRCGRASITLTEDGEIEIRGETIVSQAVGANCIRGGSVELN